jgi:hypothetical protein
MERINGTEDMKAVHIFEINLVAPENLNQFKYHVNKGDVDLHL